MAAGPSLLRYLIRRWKKTVIPMIMKMGMRLAWIPDSGHGRPQRRLLDCLAEFAANKKCGTVVACSAMREAEDNVVIWITRNEGFSDMDKLVFDQLGKILGSLSSNSKTSRVTALFLYTKLCFLSSRSI